MKTIASILLIFLVVLPGCVTPNYQPPAGQDTASLIVQSNTPETFNQQVRLFRAEDCSDYPGQLMGLLYSKRVGIDTKELISSSVPAGTPVTISVFAAVPRDDTFLEMLFKGVQQTAGENRVCEAFVSFVPERGMQYKAAYKIDGSPCSISLMAIKDTQAVAVTNARPNLACSRVAKRKLGDLMLTN